LCKIKKGGKGERISPKKWGRLAWRGVVGVVVVWCGGVGAWQKAKKIRGKKLVLEVSPLSKKS